MTTIIGVLAMGVAFTALWLAGAAMKKSEDQFSELAKALHAELSKLRGDMRDEVRAATARVQTLERRIDELQNIDQGTRDTLDAVRREVVALRDDLNATQGALPPQFRRHVRTGENRAEN
jgi:outer membrane murein-binding lipoprotein Lpp